MTNSIEIQHDTTVYTYIKELPNQTIYTLKINNHNKTGSCNGLLTKKRTALTAILRTLQLIVPNRRYAINIETNVHITQEDISLSTVREILRLEQDKDIRSEILALSKKF